MAGIGFALRKLGQRDDLLGVVQGVAHSALVSVGPWLLTILSLGSVVLLSSHVTTSEELSNFRLVIIYNFAFSLVFSGPIMILQTRYLSDRIYEQSFEETPGMMVGGLIVLYIIQLPLVVWFYFLYVDLSSATAVAAVINYFLITSMWLLSVYLSALTSYVFVTGAFIFGMAIGTFVAVALATTYGETGMLVGFNCGLALILFPLIARVLAEYPYPIVRPFRFLRKIRQYWILMLGALIYNVAIWIDKWIMWAATEAETSLSGFVSYPNYDAAMFLAYLFIVPSIAVFVFSVETSFYEKQLRFFQDIQKHVTFARIQQNHQVLLEDLWASGRNLLILQSSICVTIAILAPHLFELLTINFAQIGIFRLGLLGAMFHIFFQSLLIILSYFDIRTPVLMLQLTFLVTNVAFTYVSAQMGFMYYGYGYFLACVVTFVITALTAAYYLKQLPYQAFIRNNTSVR